MLIVNVENIKNKSAFVLKKNNVIVGLFSPQAIPEESCVAKGKRLVEINFHYK